jgi:hypothetical protein
MRLPPEDIPKGSVLIGELPTYRGRQPGVNKATPTDLIKLAVILGEFLGLYRRKVDVVRLVTPAEWKGSVPKDICHSRIEDVLGPDEKMPENHNARDAVGIGLFELGRYKR